VRHLLLLTATPHSGHTDSYASVLAMLDPALVRGERIDRTSARDHVCQRRRRDIEEWFASRETSPFPARDQQELVIEPSRAQRALLDGLRAYTDELDDRADAAPMNAWIAAHVQKRALSSPHALRRTIRRRIDTVRAQRDAERTERERAEAEIEVTDDLGG